MTDERAERPAPLVDEPTDTPPLDRLADENDTLCWDRSRHGRFIEHATGYHEPEPTTIPYRRA